VHNIEVDFDVFKALTTRRPSEAVTENDVLRQILGLPVSTQRTGVARPAPPAAGDWVAKGVRFPAGTEFRATYKGQIHLGRVEEGALLLGGKRFVSPSAAAMSITGGHANGWRFWQCRLPGQAGWRPLESLRGSGV
jgi:hypothetical protein